MEAPARVASVPHVRSHFSKSVSFPRIEEVVMRSVLVLVGLALVVSGSAVGQVPQTIVSSRRASRRLRRLLLSSGCWRCAARRATRVTGRLPRRLGAHADERHHLANIKG
jgi:hypothetical protein